MNPRMKVGTVRGWDIGLAAVIVAVVFLGWLTAPRNGPAPDRSAWRVCQAGGAGARRAVPEVGWRLGVAGDLPRARAINTSLVPLTDAIMRTSQGPIMAKAALTEIGILDHATVRLPLLESPPGDLDKLALALAPRLATPLPA